MEITTVNYEAVNLESYMTDDEIAEVAQYLKLAHGAGQHQLVSFSSALEAIMNVIDDGLIPGQKYSALVDFLYINRTSTQLFVRFPG